jgi:hypothetical protein
MYNYAFYAYMFYRGIHLSSTVESAIGFVSFLKNIYRWARVKMIKDEDPDIGWVLIFTDGTTV